MDNKALVAIEEVPDNMPIVSSHGRREELLLKLDKLKIRNRTAREKAIIDSSAGKFTWSFVYFAWEKHGVSKVQLKTLDREDLVELGELIYESVKTRALVQKYFWMPVSICTIFGNLWIWDDFNNAQRSWHSWQYICTANMLKKAYGKDWFPYGNVVAECNSD